MSAGDLDPRLAGLSVEELRRVWIGAFACEPPALRTRELLGLAIAYRIQAQAQGDLSGATRRRLAELGRRFARDRDYSPVAGPALKPGSSIIKAWRGVRYEVRVLESGFAYQGERFGSLSEVAFASPARSGTATSSSA